MRSRARCTPGCSGPGVRPRATTSSAASFGAGMRRRSDSGSRLTRGAGLRGGGDPASRTDSPHSGPSRPTTPSGASRRFTASSGRGAPRPFARARVLQPVCRLAPAGPGDPPGPHPRRRADGEARAGLARPESSRRSPRTGAVRLTAPPEERQSLKEAVLALAAEPLEIDFLHLYPRAAKVALDPGGLSVTLDTAGGVP